MNIIATALLAVLLIASMEAGVVAQPAADPQRVAPAADNRDRSDGAAALPRQVERPHVLGMSVATAIFVAALILFVIVLAAASVSRDEDRPYRRTDIDPRL